jgi:hypothetical protein
MQKAKKNPTKSTTSASSSAGSLGASAKSAKSNPKSSHQAGQKGASGLAARGAQASKSEKAPKVAAAQPAKKAPLVKKKTQVIVINKKGSVKPPASAAKKGSAPAGKKPGAKPAHHAAKPQAPKPQVKHDHKHDHKKESHHGKVEKVDQKRKMAVTPGKAPIRPAAHKVHEKPAEKIAEKGAKTTGFEEQESVDSSKGLKVKKSAEVERIVEAPQPEEEVILTDAEGRRYCRMKDCDQAATVDGGYCRFHYLLFWKNIQSRKKILSEGKLERYIEELTARYPDKYLELLRKDLRSEKDFMAAIQELEIDDSGVDNEFEDEAQSYLDEVRGVTGESNSEREEDF